MQQQIILFAILAAALGLFVWGRLRFDLVALIALLVAVVTDVVPAGKAFAGFGHPAVITVAAILVLSRALRNANVIERLADLLNPLSDKPVLQMVTLCAITACASAFMNNVGALALMLPVALSCAGDSQRPASQVLMPVSFSSLLGGLITLIGTPPNIIIASMREEVTGTAFAVFDFTPVGLAIACAGVLYVSLVGWRLLPTRQQSKSDDPGQPLLDVKDYITEVRLPIESHFVGKRLAQLEALGQGNVSIVALVRGKDRILAPSGFFRLQADDIFMVECDAGSLKRFVERAELDLVGAAELSAEHLRSERVGLFEAVIAPGSRMERRTALSMRLHSRYGLNLLAVARQGESIRERLGEVRFSAGDVLLLQGERASVPDALAMLGCLPLAERALDIGRRKDVVIAAPVIFVVAVALVATGVLPPQIAFAGGAVAMVLAGVVNLRELYDAVDWPIVVLLAALIPLGAALEATGGSMTIASPLLSLGGQVPVGVILALLMIVTMLLSDVMNNAATAVLMGPIGITVAQGLDLNVEPFLMAVAVGAASTFLTPIGHQSNLLVMGPGGYRFSDYWRMGLTLDLLILAVAVPMILLIWPV
jgi:di/tricarboxylate transporter